MAILQCSGLDPAKMASRSQSTVETGIDDNFQEENTHCINIHLLIENICNADAMYRWLRFAQLRFRKQV